MDYSTFDTHTQHTRLCSNNAYLICDCTCSNVMCMLKYLLIKPKKIFECFICFLKWFYAFMFLVFVQNAYLFFSSKKKKKKPSSEEVLREAHNLELPAKCAWGKLKSHIFIQKLSLLPREYFTTKHFSQNGF